MFLFRFVLAIVASVLVSACGGGGSDSSPAPVVPVVVTPTPIVPAPVVMSCASNAVWSNPAVYSTVYQDCVAPIGVQALVTPMNTMVDTTCVPTVGVQLSASCRAYMANGTMLLADTGIFANNHALMWMAYVGFDTKSNLVLLDSVTVAPIGMMVLPGSLVWLIGNPTGVAISEKVGYSSSNGQVINSNKQVKWDGAKLVATCYTNCPI